MSQRGRTKMCGSDVPEGEEQREAASEQVRRQSTASTPEWRRHSKGGSWFIPREPPTRAGPRRRCKSCDASEPSWAVEHCSAYIEGCPLP